MEHRLLENRSSSVSSRIEINLLLLQERGMNRTISVEDFYTRTDTTTLRRIHRTVLIML